VIEATSEFATPLILVDGIENNNGTDILLTTNNLIVSGNIQTAPNTAIVSPVIEATSEFATPLILVDELEPNTGDTITITTDKLNTNISGATAGATYPYKITYTNPATATSTQILGFGQSFSNVNKTEARFEATNVFFGGASTEQIQFGSETNTQAVVFSVSGSDGGGSIRF
jgi:hypothetical protein